VSVSQHPVVSASLPPMWNPPGIRTWRKFPSAGNPLVPVSSPLLVTRDPYITPGRRGCPSFNNCMRWPHVHDDILCAGNTST